MSLTIYHPLAFKIEQDITFAMNSLCDLGTRNVSVFLLCIVLFDFLLVSTVRANSLANVPKNVLVIVESAKGDFHFCTEIASDNADIRQGLMHRKSLDVNAGMLFIFDPPRIVRFWMKDTLLPLDMLFIDIHGSIVSIAHQTEPNTLKLVGPPMPVRRVLEINGGLSEQLGIRMGDRVRTAATGNCMHPYQQ